MTKSILKGGIIIGITSVIISIIEKFFFEFSSMSALFTLLPIAISVFAPAFIGSKFKNSLPEDEPFSFRIAFTYSVLMLLIASTIQFVSSVVIYLNTPADALVERILATYKNSETVMSQTDIDDLYISVSNKGLIIGRMVFGVLFDSAIYGFIVALIIRKKSPSVG